MRSAAISRAKISKDFLGIFFSFAYVIVVGSGGAAPEGPACRARAGRSVSDSGAVQPCRSLGWNVCPWGRRRGKARGWAVQVLVKAACG